VVLIFATGTADGAPVDEGAPITSLKDFLPHAAPPPDEAVEALTVLEVETLVVLLIFSSETGEADLDRAEEVLETSEAAVVEAAVVEAADDTAMVLEPSTVGGIELAPGVGVGFSHPLLGPETPAATADASWGAETLSEVAGTALEDVAALLPRLRLSPFSPRRLEPALPSTTGFVGEIIAGAVGEPSLALVVLPSALVCFTLEAVDAGGEGFTAAGLSKAAA
jgi:hypothetical protein